MGSGIAHACAQAGFSVSMRDVKDEFVEKGLARIREALDKRVAKGKMAKSEQEAILGRVVGTTSAEDAVQNADLVIEAVFEDQKVKKDVFAEVEKSAKADALFATNTSSLSVSELSRVTKRADRFIGLHFFNPAAVNVLVEVVAGEKTDRAVVEALLSFSRDLGKVPIETADSPGFAVNRFFVPFLNEACRMAEEGTDYATIEGAAKEAFGISMGPFELMNFTGMPIALHAQETLHRALGEFYKPSALLRKQVESAQPFPLSGAPDSAKTAPVKEQLLGVCFAIAASLVDENVATPADVDKGATLGLRWKRGPFAMMNEVGTRESLNLVEAASSHHKGRLPVSRALRVLGEVKGVPRGQPWKIPRVRITVSAGVAVVTIDRPEAMNALNADVLA
ncbi:MAG TPA: 3-hydroxyacyl-CoA dehydrogenase NAD-binding domain-containing protein, partial [Burkholderiales bacterium]|nr:3-hydroxyacyl-CoA dehydrogenase NAD-binding domain-containing protein [Burkholderiales bacterium]